MGNLSVEPKNTRLMLHSINYRRIYLLCFFSLFLILTAGAMEYIVSPATSDYAGASVNGEEVIKLEDTIEPYWHFLLWLAAMQILSVIDTLLYPAKLIFAILGFRVTDRSNAVGVLKRKNIYAFIKANPGTCASEIVNNMDLNRGALRYHLNVLETENMIKPHCDRGKIRYFQNNFTYGEKEKRVISAFQNETARMIISKILREECNTNGDLAQTTGISKGTITWHMKQLKESGLIEENKIGRNTIYSVNPAYRDAIEKHI